MSRCALYFFALVAAFVAPAVLRAEPDSNKGKDGKEDVVGAVWSYTITKDGQELSGQFRVSDKEIFKGPEKVGTVHAKDRDETTLVFTNWPEMNGRAVLRKNTKAPPGASGWLTKADKSKWRMKVRWKDG